MLACFRKEGMPEQTARASSRALGIHVDTTPYALSFEDTVAYLAARLPGYDVVVSCQNVADIYPALERLALRPPLIEHGGLVSRGAGRAEASHRALCRRLRAASATRPPRRMPGREHHAVEIPSMVDLGRVRPRRPRPGPRRAWHRAGRSR